MILRKHGSCRRLVGINSRWNNLICGWKMEEISGVRRDVLGIRDLTDNNTVGSAAGKIGNAASFITANVESLSRPSSDAVFEIGDNPFTIAAWVSNNGAAANHALIAKDGVSSQRGWVLYSDTSSQTFFALFPGPVQASVGGLPVDDTLYFVVAWHDPTANTVNIQVNNGSVNSVSFTGPVASSTSPLYLGCFSDAATNPHNGKIDEVYMFDTVKDAAWRADMWNGGAGRQYPN